ncbi:DUF5719 family protein [Streptomonospora litoralis]|uniref:Secreted protein n=1 Tax=Streptomonospora litoralis TaxID=2498135 RepID=A0A4P6PX15_9ACTN|nr:DUF5719 family protein [Streptomonospora litoralis]QBI52728.1 hypothetical protein EKD16_04605 [Streptomonospora litoralis]
MRLIVENRFALLVLVLIGLTALFGVAFATRSVGASPRGAESPATAPVQSALRVCPPPQGDDRAAQAAAFATGPDGESRGGGELSATENTGEAAEVGEPASAGRLWSADTGGSAEHTLVAAEGAAAAGLEVAQTTIGEDGAYATEVRCAEPGISTWFAAPGGTDLEGLRLLLANPDQEAATVNVDVYGADGPVYSDETRGISVGARGRSEVDLTELIQGSRAAVVHVRTNSGRVAASLFADRGGSGRDWVPPTAPPADTHVVPAIPSGSGTKRLVIAAPGDSPVTADVRLYTEDGRAEHDTLTGLSVPPAAGTFLSLEGPLSKKAGTAVVEADGPVVVGVAFSRSGGDDTAYTAAAPPLQGPLHGTAVVPANPEGTRTRLVFGALAQPAAVVVTPVAADGATGEPARVEVGAERTAVADVEAPDGAHALTVRVEGEAPVYAGRVLTHESGGDRATSLQPLQPAPSEVALPAVEDGLTAIVR